MMLIDKTRKPKLLVPEPNPDGADPRAGRDRGGRVVRAAATAPQLGDGTTARVSPINEVRETPRLMRHCKQRQVDNLSLGRIYLPLSVVATQHSNGLIVGEKLKKHCRPVGAEQLHNIQNPAPEADAVAMVSPKDAEEKDFMKVVGDYKDIHDYLKKWPFFTAWCSTASNDVTL